MAELIDSTKAALVYQGTVITQRQEMLSLTDMWKAAGADPQQAPAKWRALPVTKAFVEHVELTIGKSDSLFQVKEGRGGTTYAHWQIALAYAKYLSPEFHMWCNTVVRERMEGKLVSAHVAVATLDAEARRSIGGIAKAVMGKALDDRLAPVEAAVLSIATQLRQIVGGFDPRAVVTEFRPMLDILIEEGVQPKKRRALSSRCSKSCLRFCIATGRGAAVRESRETKRWLFQSDAVREWLERTGRQIIADHKAAIAGQTVLQFSKPKPVGRKAPEPSAHLDG